jgi:hypothetical protein
LIIATIGTTAKHNTAKEMEFIVRHFNSLPEEDKQIVQHYTHEIDPDDWASCPLMLSYEVINFILKQRYIPKSQLCYEPLLIKEKVLSLNDIQQQIENAQKMRRILDGFPCIPHDITVYRGFLKNDIYFVKSTYLFAGDEITIPHFLSTSLSYDSATRFTSRAKPRCYWKIEIPKGFPIPMIKESIDTINIGMEDEVLINMGAILQCTGNMIIDTNTHLMSFVLKGFSKAIATRGYWETMQQIGKNLYDKV